MRSSAAKTPISATNWPTRPWLNLHDAQCRSSEELLWLKRYRDLAQTLSQFVDQQAALIEEQQKLLTEQRELLRLLSR